MKLKKKLIRPKQQLLQNLSEGEEDAILEKLEQGVLDPEISDYIYWSKLSAEQIADKVLSYKPINL